ncbi:hypothetical protein EST38_g12459 [Candolleomyces aberdarensis]|uniref:Uncharacterized protein n=1 Tax=Candolleomyces aberdarensis TaxID=2316362 RepID=A0A4Q2D2D4_9AGAR|nr:hypothetical protein EST38_g12459 [Candolleomyces aberdarensis]
MPDASEAALRLFASLAATIGAYGAYKVVAFLYSKWTYPLRFLPGPPSPGFLAGSEKELWDAESYPIHEKWLGDYGPTMKIPGFLGANHLYTVDLKALNHILMNGTIYPET